MDLSRVLHVDCKHSALEFVNRSLWVSLSHMSFVHIGFESYDIYFLIFGVVRDTSDDIVYIVFSKVVNWS